MRPQKFFKIGPRNSLIIKNFGLSFCLFGIIVFTFIYFLFSLSSILCIFLALIRHTFLERNTFSLLYSLYLSFSLSLLPPPLSPSSSLSALSICVFILQSCSFFLLFLVFHLSLFFFITFKINNLTKCITCFHISHFQIKLSIAKCFFDFFSTESIIQKKKQFPLLYSNYNYLNVEF
jgi:hypothetical protein